MNFKRTISRLRSVVFGFAVLAMALPVASQEYGGCAIDTLSDTPRVAEFAQDLNSGNYRELAESIDMRPQYKADYPA